MTADEATGGVPLVTPSAGRSSSPSTGSLPALAPLPAGLSGSVELSPSEPGVVVLRGEVDAAVVAQVDPGVLAGGVRVADVAAVTFVDSGGIHLLLRLHQASPDGLALRGAPEDGLVLAVLATLGLDGLFGRA